MVRRLIVVIILQCIQTSNHYTELLKLIQCYMPIIPQFFFKGTSLVAQMVKRAYNVGGLGSIPGSGRSPGEENGNPLQSSCLENPMDTGTC